MPGPIADLETLELVTAAAAEPIDLTLARSHLRIPHEQDDAYINQCIRAARDAGEIITERRFMTQTWRMYLDAFPDSGRALLIPYPPLQSITSITYVDENGTTQTWASSNYVADTAHEPAWLRLAYGQVWPATRVQPRAVTVTFVCGYGDAGTDLPPSLLQALLISMSKAFEFREDVITGTIATEIPGMDRIWWPHRILGADI